MIIFPCKNCNTPLSVTDGQAGTMVSCPTCLAEMRVPTQAREMATAGVTRSAPPPPPPRKQTVAPPELRATVPGGRRYGFNCPYCSSRLEANEGMAGQEGQCPTCDNNIVIPILDRYNRLIDPTTRKIIKPDPHPVHAYAAAGERAPDILRDNDGKQRIVCPRCSHMNDITSNNCKSCKMPFTMEGTSIEATGASNFFCVASLVLGILGIPAYCTVIIPGLAIASGIVGLVQVSKGTGEGGKGMAIAGLILGTIGALAGINRQFF